MSVHVQTRRYVYVVELDRILDRRNPKDVEAFQDCADYPGTIGSCQGIGIESMWYDDDPDEYNTNVDPAQLRARAHQRGIEGKSDPDRPISLEALAKRSHAEEGESRRSRDAGRPRRPWLRQLGP